MQTTKWWGIQFVCTSLILCTATMFLEIGASAQVDLRRAAEWAVSERGPHHRVWAEVVQETNRLGQVTLRTISSYTELQTGLHRWDGQWIEARPAIEITADGAAVTGCAYWARFAANANWSNAVEVVTPEGLHLRSRVAGISYSEGGKAVLIAQTKDSFGLVVGKDQVVYTNVFDTVEADLQYVVGPAGTEQSIIWREPLPSPMDLGFSPDCWVQVITEFFAPPEPDRKLESSGFDELISFGSMVIPRGRGFAIGAEAQPEDSLAVQKQWIMGVRTFLVEQVPYSKVAEKFRALERKKQGAAVRPERAGEIRSLLAALPLPSPQPAGRDPLEKMVIAKLDVTDRPGFLLDYSLLTAQTNFTFAANTNYYVSGLVNLSGTTTIEGGTIIKFTNHTSAKISMSGPLVCETEQYRPAVLTSKDDNTVGETITGSTGNPTNYNSGTYLYSSVSDTTNAIQYLRLSYAGTGLAFDGLTNGVWHCQFLKCNNGIDSYNQKEVRLFNVLMAVSSNCIVNSTNIQGQHLTVDVCSNLVSASSPSLALTNSILTAVAAVGADSPTYDHVATAASGAGIYTNGGAASYYLVDNSTNRNAGGTGLEAMLADALKLRTTCPPVVISTNITAATILSPQAARDTDAPDLGYHYDPLDFVTASIGVSASLTLTNGVAIGTYGTSAQSGLSLNSGDFVSVGTPGCLNWVVRYNTVQEQSTSTWSGTTAGRSIQLGASSASVNVRFTGWSLLGASGNHFYDATDGTTPSAFTHSRFGGGNITIDPGAAALTNCLLERVYLKLQDDFDSGRQWYLCNNLLRGGTLYYRSMGDDADMRASDNLFDRTVITKGPSSAGFTHDYNGYVTNQNRLTPTNSSIHDVVLTNTPTFESSQLGRYYYPANDGMLSLLINAGSRNATNAGLYHFTTTTNQVKETNSVVDIGFHYVAVDSGRNPLDTDADGLADYLENGRGNGSYDSGTDLSNWQSNDTDLDGFSDGEEVLIYQTNPKVANAPGISRHPQSLDACAGGPATFTVTPTGSVQSSYAFQWRFYGTNLTGATASSFTRTNVSLGDAGDYTVVVTNAGGSITSAVATLKLCGDLSFGEFTNAASLLQLNGNAVLTNTSDGGVLQLTPALDSQVGSAFLKQLVCLSNNASFSTYFAFRLSNGGGETDHDGMPGADGVAFTIQTVGNTAIGAGGGGIGYVGITNSVTVEFDTWYNPYVPPFTDPNLPNGESNGYSTNFPFGDGNHIGVTFNGTNVSAATAHFGSYMNDATNIWYAWIDYDGSVSNLQVRLTNSPALTNPPARPVAAILTNTFRSLDYLTSSNVFLGFSGATGGAHNQQDILLWQFIPRFQPIGTNAGGPPTVSILTPTNSSSSLARDTVIVGATASSPVTNIAWVQFFASTNSGSSNYIGSATFLNTNGLYEVYWPPLLGGSYTLTAVAADKRGSNAVSTPVTIAVRSRPTVAITTPTNQANVGPVPTNITVQADAAATGASITNVSYFIGTNAHFVTNFIASSTSGPSYGITWSVTTAGDYFLQATATDSLGATAASHAVKVSAMNSNRPPVVNAGPDLRIRRPNSAFLAGSVSDDGLPLNGAVTVLWTNVWPGNGSATFADEHDAVTTASFSGLGFYTNRLIASDGEFTITDETVVEVLETNLPPVLNPGTNQTITVFALQLQGAVEDDGMPDVDSLVTTWRKVDGPGTVTFANAGVTNTIAAFGALGAYILELSASDGELTTRSNITITIKTNLIGFGAAGYDYTFITNTDIRGIEFLTNHFLAVDTNDTTVFTNTGVFGNLYSNFYTTNFVASGWLSGSAAFGNLGCPPAPINSEWPGDSDNHGTLLVRKWFQVPSGTTNLSFAFTVDNVAVVFLNGNFVGWVYHVDCAHLGDVIFNDVSSSFWHEGSNLLAICAIDNGGGTFLDFKVGANERFNPPGSAANQPPTVVVGPDQFLTGTNVTELNGFVLDDGRPPYTVATEAWWELVGAPQDAEAYFEYGGEIYTNSTPPITFTNFLNFSIPVSFSATGSFVLKLEADDTYYFPYALVTIQVRSNGITGPTVSLTAPTNNAVLPADAVIFVAANATPSGGTITNVDFLAATTNGTYVIGGAADSPYGITWVPGIGGDYSLIARAFDSDGRWGISSAVNVHILPFVAGNQSPHAGLDQPIVLANSVNDRLHVLDNDTDADGDSLTITEIIPSTTPGAHGTATIIDGGKDISYTPPPGQGYPADGFSYRISDGKGGTALGGVFVYVYASVAPAVQITSPWSYQEPYYATNAGAVMPIKAHVEPSQFITKVEFFRSNIKLGEVTNGVNGDFTLNWIATAQCLCPITAQATDRFGQVGTSEAIYIDVTKPGGVADPVAIVASTVSDVATNRISTNDFGGVRMVIREGVFDLYGKAYQPGGSNVSWTLSVYAADGTWLRDLTPLPHDVYGGNTNATDSSSASNKLATCDLTTLENGVYDLKLVVNSAFITTDHTVRFMLDSNLKLGQFGFSQQDLVIPVAGIPLTVVRTYNTLNPKRGDFGYGWTYAINDLDVVLDEEREPTIGWDEEDLTLPDTEFSQRVGGGRDVTLTLPDGQRTTFYFSLDPGPPIDEWTPCFCYEAHWTPPPGVTATLTMADGLDNTVYDLYGVVRGGTFWQAAPNVPLEVFDIPGFVLTTSDGTRYHLDREYLGSHFVWQNNTQYLARAFGQPRLAWIEQPTGDLIRVSRDSIAHYNISNALTREIIFQRNNDAGLISGISDPNGQTGGSPTGPLTMKYEYDNQDNLIRVLQLVNRATGSYVTNSFSYTNRNFPHYITGMINSKGVQVVRNLYDDTGKLIGIIDAAGRTNSFEHDISARREVQYDRRGQPTVFGYDARGNVTSATDALGHTRTFTYDLATGFQLSATDALTNTTYYTNDAMGNVTDIVLPYPAGADPAAYTTHFTYNTNGDQTSIRRPTGGVITNEFDPTTKLLLAVKDGNSNVISSTTYNSRGLPATETDAFGILKYTYDGMGNLTFMTNSLGKVVSSLYDANGNLTNLVDNSVTSSVTYDAMNRETGADYGNNISVSYGHDGEGDWSSVDGPTLGHMERKMDDQGRLAGWETANGSSPSFAYDPSGRLEFETNSIGVVTRSVYNAVGWLTASTNLATGAGTTYDYDAAGQRTVVTNALGFTTRYAYYPSGSLKAMTNALGTNWLYSDAAGACAACGNAVSVTDPFGRVTEDIATPYGLPVSTVWHFGALVSSNYTEYLAGLTTEEQEAQEYPVAITDESGRTRRYDYTDQGQLYRATDLSGSTWWTNQFDLESGVLTNVLSPTGDSLSYVYDDLDNVKALGFGDGNWLTNFYDDENLLSGARLPSGAQLTNAYDFAGRLTNRQTKVSGVVTEAASFTFDSNDAVTLMSDNTGSTTNLYDAAGRLWGIDYPSGASVRYQLDVLDRIAAITNKATAGGTVYVTRYQYDPLGSVTNVIDPFNGNTAYEYDAVGRRIKRTLPNDVVTEWQYDWRDRVTNILHKANGGSTLASFTYWRNPGGEPNKIVREDGSYVEFRYDAALRLTNEVYKTSGGSVVEEISYGYDAAGSRTNLVKGGTTLTNSVSGGYRITAVNNATSGTTAESYSYDTGGRVTQINRDSATLNLGYNTADQVTAVTNGSAWVTYAHDANGRRTIATNYNGSTTVRRLLVAPTPGTELESSLLIANASGSVKQGYVFLGDDPILRFDGSGNVTYYLEDAMGSIAALTDSSGASTTATFSYDGFGNIRSQSGSMGAPTDTGGDFRFHGAWLEEGTGLYNMRAREYDARLGRFTSRDPDAGEFRTAETIQPYTYAVNNPQAYSDPSGAFTIIEINITTFYQASLQSMRGVGISKARSKILKWIGEAVKDQVVKGIKGIFPFSDMLSDFGRAKESSQFLMDFFCDLFPTTDRLFLEVPMTEDGTPKGNGFNCAKGIEQDKLMALVKAGYLRPDFVLGSKSPISRKGGFNKTWVVGELKSSLKTLYEDFRNGGKKPKQFNAICNYARKHTYSHTAIFICPIKGNGVEQRQVELMMLGAALRHKILPFVVVIFD